MRIAERQSFFVYIGRKPTNFVENWTELSLLPVS